MKKSFSAWRKRVNEAMKADPEDPPVLLFRFSDGDEFIEIDISELDKPNIGTYRATFKDGSAIECRNDDHHQSNPVAASISQITRGYDTLLQSTRVHVEAVSTRYERIEKRLLTVEQERDSLRDEVRKLKQERDEAKENFLDEEFVNLIVQLATIITGRARDEQACELIAQLFDSLPEDTSAAIAKHAGPDLLAKLAKVVNGEGVPDAH